MARRTILGSIVFCTVFWAIAAHAMPVSPITFLYAGPGGAPAPCNTTLQACINGAFPGDTIEIATNARIDESLTIDKSLSLISGGGFAPLIGSANPATPDGVAVSAGGGTSVSVILKGIDFDAASISVDF